MGRMNSTSARPSCASLSQKLYPSRTISATMNVPYTSSVSPPSTLASTYKSSPASSISSRSCSSSRSSSPSTPPSLGQSKSYASTAYPDWPQRDLLSASFCGNQASSHISDEDLLDFEQLGLGDNLSVPAEKTAGISWEATRQPPVMLQSIPSPRRKMRPTPKRSRRSSPLNGKSKTSKGMSPIHEAPE